MTDSSDPALSLPAEPAPRPPASGRGYLDGLNPEQRQAVESLDGPLLVLAGAGTGKTRVLTTRLAHILATGRARPGQVLAVTFTNKAAREMIGRVERLIGRPTAGLWFGTFHAIAARILRRHAELAGLKPDFTILDTDDQERLLKQLIRADNIDEKRWPARTLSVIIQRWKDRGLTADKVAGADGADFANGRAPALYAAYQERLRAVNAADFGDLLLHNLTLFTRHRDVLADYQRRFKVPAGGRVSGHQRRAISLAPAAGADASQHLLRRRRRPVDLRLARRRGRQHSPLREKFPRRAGGAAGAQLPLHRTHPRRSLGPHRPQRRPARQDALDRGGEMGEKVRLTETWDGQEEARVVGDTIEALQRKMARASIPSPSWCAPASRPLPSRNASSPSACPTA